MHTMDDEFKLCWKNFQDNIAIGFQNLYDRGDLVDVTLACDGKLLHAHKIVLAICSPYFQEIFITNPCKHPIIILKDVTFNIMCELLEFMYQGVVNVKHTELQSFMKIGQLLQIKGLATNSSGNPTATAAATQAAAIDKGANNTVNTNTSKKINNNNCNETQEIREAEENTSSPKSNSNSEENTNSQHNISNNNNNNNNSNNSSNNNNNSNKETRPTTPTTPPTSSAMNYLPNIKNFSENNLTLSPTHSSSYHHHHHHQHSTPGLSMKRLADKEYNSDALALYARKQQRKSSALSEQNDQHESGASTMGEQSMEQMNAEEFFLSSLPHISLMDPKYDLGGVKRELSNSMTSVENSSSNNNNNNNHGANNMPSTSRTSFPTSAYGFDFNLYKPNTSNNSSSIGTEYPNDLHMPNDYTKNFANHMDIPQIAPGERWFQGKLEFMLSQRGKPLLVHDGHTFGIQYVRKDKKYWQCNLSRKFNCKARVTTTDTGEIIVTNNEHCHTEIRQHLRKDYQRNKVMINALLNLSSMRQHSAVTNTLNSLKCLPKMLSCSPLQQQHQQQQQYEDTNILDLAKGTSSSSTFTQDEESAMVHDLSTSTSTTGILQQQYQNEHHDTESENENTSLDCGLPDTPGT